MTLIRIRRSLVALLALGLTLACGSGGGSSSGAAAGSSSSGSSSGSSSSETVEFKLTEYTIAPATQTLKPGTYTFKITNVGQFPHDMHVAAAADGTEVGGSQVLTQNQSGSFTVTLKAGTYTTWCAVNAHRSMGMEGRLTVQ